MTSYHFSEHEHLKQVISFDPKEEYLRKTIEVKNKNIDELLKELKETQELYQTYKAQYLSEQKKMKAKIAELNNKLDLQSGQLQMQKQFCSKLKGDLKVMQDKEQKMIQAHLAQSKEQNTVRKELEDKCRELMRVNTQLKERNEGIGNRYVNIEERCLQTEKAAAGYREQIRQLREQFQAKSKDWLEEKTQLINRIQEQQQKKKNRFKVNKKLDAIEQKIMDTMKKI